VQEVGKLKSPENEMSNGGREREKNFLKIDYFPFGKFYRKKL